MIPAPASTTCVSATTSATSSALPMTERRSSKNSTGAGSDRMQAASASVVKFSVASISVERA
jgi:hypothetical protein